MKADPINDLVIRNGWVITMDAHGRRHALADVAVSDGAITAVGESLPGKGKHEIDAGGNAVLPGLVNAHTHTTLLRGVAEDLPLMRWLYEITFPVDAAFRPEHLHAAAVMNQLEMIRGGTTTFLDIFRFPAEAAAVAEESGLRAVFCPQIIDEPLGAGETLESNLTFIQDWHDRQPQRIYTWFGPHAPYSVHLETYREISRLAEQYDVRFHTHLSETEDEVRLLRERYGKSPVAVLDEVGVLNRRLSVAHGVHLDGEDIRRLAEGGVAVVYNPSSNMKIASGVAPIPELLAAGVKVGLGTDSNLSNNNLDMFEEMRLGAVLQKLIRKDAAAMPCEQMLRMATIDSAACLGMDDRIGSIEVGKRADLIIVNLHQPHLYPLLPEPDSNVIEQLVYSASAADVATTIVEGKILMHDRQVFTLDEESAEAMVLEAAQDLIQRAGVGLRLKKKIYD